MIEVDIAIFIEVWLDMDERILCVDDEPCILQAYQRALRKHFVIDSASGGEEALAMMAEKGPYAVIVADMRMPGMNGIQFLVKAKELSPDSVRMMLTGNADQQTALEAVNEGHIFRFMTKPCPPEQFAKSLEAGIAQYRLITLEHELLSKTLSGSIKVMTDVLGLVNPVAFGRSSRVHRLVSQISRDMNLRRAWLIEIAAMLSQIGCVAIPEDTLTKVFQGQGLFPGEKKAFSDHPKTARELLKHIPRLEEVVDIIVHQNDLFQREVISEPSPRAEDIVLGSNILKLALDWDTLISSGMSNLMAIAEINNRQGYYHPDVVASLRKIMEINDMRVLKWVYVYELKDGSVLAEDVRSKEGTILCSKDQEVTPLIRARLHHYVATVGKQLRLRVFESIQQEVAGGSDNALSLVSK
jgi:response regulator RpfG family c-di-GMP phosphodiesterase